MAKVVEFYLTCIGPCTPGGNSPAKQIYSFEDLINYTNSYYSSMPYTIELKCVVKTYDENKYESANAVHILGQTKTYKKHPIIEEKIVDTYKIYVGDKVRNKPRLIYADDVENFVKEQYPLSLKEFQLAYIKCIYDLKPKVVLANEIMAACGLNTDIVVADGTKADNNLNSAISSADKTRPVMLDKVKFAYIRVPKDDIPNPKEGAFELVRVPLIRWHYLTPKDNFVDRKTLMRITEDGTIGEVPIDLKQFFTKKR